jgi:hypothetical protein
MVAATDANRNNTTCAIFRFDPIVISSLAKAVLLPGYMLPVAYWSFPNVVIDDELAPE